VNGKPIRALSDATIKAILERRDRDERGEVPHPEDLVTDDDLLKLGLLAPDAHFLAKRVMGCRDAEKLEDTYRRAVLDLLHSDIPLSQLTRDMTAGELQRLRWPDPEAEKRARRLIKTTVIRADLEVAIAENKRKGIKHPVKEAKDKIAKHWGHHSGEALRKALQPGRVSRRPRG